MEMYYNNRFVVSRIFEELGSKGSGRLERSINYRLSKARFPVIKRACEFDFGFQEELAYKEYRVLL